MQVNVKKAKDSKRVLAAKRGWETRRKRRALKAVAVNTPAQPVQFEPAVVAEPKVEELDEKKPFISSFFADKGMAQIYSSGLEYAFVNEKGEQCHPFAYCKDFLQDAIWATINQKPVAIYGFSYEPGNNPKLDLEGRCRLAVRFKGKNNMAEMCAQSVKFLNALEKDLGFGPTTLTFGGGTGKSEVWVFHGDVLWMHAPPLISMYSLLIRVGLNYTGGDWEKQLEKTELLGSNDRDYLYNARPAILKLKKKNFRDVFAEKRPDNYPADCGVSSMHNSSGIVALGSNGVANQVNKNWKSKTL